MMHGLAAGALRASRAAIALAYLLSIMTSVAQAQHVLNELGTAPLLGFGTMHSAGELRERVQDHRAMFETASADLGLTSAETAQLEAAIGSEDVQWVRIPRHLDEMTWAWDGSVYMYRDVVIPPNSYGWEIDIPVGSTVHALFIPAACGNLSLVERSRQISYRPPAPRYVPQCPPGTNGSPPNCYAPAQCPPGTSGTPPNCYAPQQQCPPGTSGVPPNCYAPQPPPEEAAPPAQLTPVVVKTVVKNNLDWWVIPLAFIGFFVGVHYHNNYYFYPPSVPKCQCTPPPPPPSCPPTDP